MSVKMKYGAGERLRPANAQIDLLWENPAPSSDFAAQKVALSLSAYKFVIIVATASTTDANGGFAFGRVGDGITYNIMLRNYNTNVLISYARTFTVDSTGVTFSTGMSDTSQTDGRAIPRAIYGVKF